jgi:DNA (cytosine-5)-methyltransferase 1
MMRALNLYSCLGGNRYKWNEVADENGIDLSVTAVEIDPELASLYQERFPDDKVIVADAHQYLLDHFSEFDFIWSSPPCPTHSRANYWGSKSKENRAKPYPDLSLYQEIIFLKNYFNGQWIVENVIPYYEPLIQANKRGRHLYWTNFGLPTILSKRRYNICQGKNELKRACEFHEFDFYQYKGDQRTDKIARNLVDYEAGRTIFETALGVIRKRDVNQTELFT